MKLNYEFSGSFVLASLPFCHSQALMSAFRMGLGYFLDRKGGPVYTYQETLLPKFVDQAKLAIIYKPYEYDMFFCARYKG